jgi:hypothetical protein
LKGEQILEAVRRNGWTTPAMRSYITQILAQMKPKGRYNIGIAQRRGVSIIEDS